MQIGPLIAVAVAVIGIVAGWLASFIVGGGGLIKYLIWGVLGSVVGGLLLPAVGINVNTGTPLLDTILVATIGAVVLVLGARIIS
ncbi:MAG: GlsB/YeaQ/YmgE family stress response membrane protein [Pseudomonadota bacterium]